MPQPPQLTPEQREAALAKAAEARRARAELKEKLKLGSLSLSDLLDQADGNDTVGKMKVLAVLESLPGVGKVREEGERTEELSSFDVKKPEGRGGVGVGVGLARVAPASPAAEAGAGAAGARWSLSVSPVWQLGTGLTSNARGHLCSRRVGVRAGVRHARAA